MLELKGKYSTAKIFIDEVESEALTTIHNILNQPVCDSLPVRIMPDCHQGAGIVIGFTMPLGKMLSPAMVGVDQGCGVLGGIFKTDKNFDLLDIDNKIRESIPMGFNINESPLIKNYPFDEVQKMVDFFVNKFNTKFNTNHKKPLINEKWLSDFIKRINIDNSKFWNSLGTLGGGNHYIELGINDLGEYLISIHSGSRNLGQKSCMYHINQAKNQTNISESEYAKRLDDIRFNTKDKKLIPIKIKELRNEMNIGINREYLQDEYLFNYLIDLLFGQHYATTNRRLMLNKIQDILCITKFDKVIETTHNNIDFSTDDFMIRKGAVSGKKNEIVLIPLNMKDGVILAKAKGNPDWNYSLNHGAGRIMSRSAAKKNISLNDVKESMNGIVCKINEHVIDESVFAYKNSDIIKESIKDNAEILSIYKPILNLKDIGKSETFKERKLKKKLMDKKRNNDRKRKEMGI